MAANFVVQGLNSFELVDGTFADIAAFAFFTNKSSAISCAYGLAAGKEPSSLELLVPLRAFVNVKVVKLGSESKTELKKMYRKGSRQTAYPLLVHIPLFGV